MIGRKEKQRKALRKLALGSTLAAAAGYVAGLLTAPKSGKETRADIKNTANSGVAEAEKELKKLHTELDKVMKEVKTGGSKAGAKAQAEAKEALNKAKEARDKAREVISAVHEGESGDQDLQKAVRQAQNALKNLRKYLKK